MRNSAGYRWGRWSARHAGRVLIGWLVLLAAAGAFSVVFLSRLSGSEFTVPGSGSARAQELIGRAFREAPQERDLVVFHSTSLHATDPAFRDVVARALDRLRGEDLVVGVTSPYAQPRRLVAPGGRTAMATLDLRGSDQQRQAAVTTYQSRLAGVRTSRVEVHLTGTSPINAALIERENSDLRLAEGVGVPIAAIVLLMAFGTVVAAALPLALGVAGVLLAFGVLGVTSFWTTWDVFVESTLAMIGIALGIDYSLFLVTRFREERSAGAEVDDAVGRTMVSAGKAVAFSATTVLISLSAMLLVNASFYRQMGYGVILAAASMLVVSWGLLPPLLGVLGDRVDRWPVPVLSRFSRTRDPERSRWARLAGVVMRRPVVFLLVGGVGMAALAVPVHSMQLGFDLSVGALGGTGAGDGYTLAGKAFSPGVVSPIQLVVHRGGEPLGTDLLQRIGERVGAVDGVQAVLGAPQVDRSGHTAVLAVAPARAPDSAAAVDLVGTLRDRVLPRATAGTGAHVDVGGLSARIRDLERVTTDGLPLVIGVVLAASFVLLLVAFRSLLLPAKAIVMNLLSVMAAYGAVVLVFQQGHLARPLGVRTTGHLQVYLPLLTFVVLFGLSMDYEVFLVSRIREEWRRTGDNRRAVTLGIAHTARVITAAATIMVAVFASFLLAGINELQQMGFALAVAVLLDATVVRLLLVPSLMRLFGRANWWLPRFLDRRMGELVLDRSPDLRPVREPARPPAARRSAGAPADDCGRD